MYTTQIQIPNRICGSVPGHDAQSGKTSCCQRGFWHRPIMYTGANADFGSDQLQCGPDADSGLDQPHTFSSASIRITGERLSLATVHTYLVKHRFWHHPIITWALSLTLLLHLCISPPTFCPPPSLLLSLFPKIFPSKPPTLNHQYMPHTDTDALLSPSVHTAQKREDGEAQG
jgi:hypothetical protein